MNYLRFLYEDLREKWKHEDELVHQRIGRLLAWEVFFLSAHGLLMSLRAGKVPGGTKILENLLVSINGTPIQPLALVGLSLPLIGLAIVYHTWSTISAAFMAMDTLKKTHNEKDLKICPDVDVAKETTDKGRNSTYILPGIFAITWMVVLWYELTSNIDKELGWEIILGLSIIIYLLSIVERLCSWKTDKRKIPKLPFIFVITWIVVFLFEYSFHSVTAWGSELFYELGLIFRKESRWKIMLLPLITILVLLVFELMYYCRKKDSNG